MIVNSSQVNNIKNNNYFLDDNSQEIQNPIFIHKYHHIFYSSKFIDGEYKDIFDELYQKYGNDHEAQQNETIKENIKNINFKECDIEWLTISNTKCEIDFVNVICKIQLTAKSSLESTYSIFTPQDLSKTESAIEIFANSKAIFKNCNFTDAQKVSVIIRDNSKAIFENCIFDNNSISCFIMDDSYAQFNNCIFMNDKLFSIFTTKHSKCEINGCSFFNLEGKAIFAKNDSEVYITNSKITNCSRGAVTILEHSKLFMDGGIKIVGCENTAVRVAEYCQIKAHDVTIENTNGNAINLYNSKGYIVDCFLKHTIHPTIAIVGHKSNPIFHYCILSDNLNTFCVICKNGSRPLFDNCSFLDCSSNCFSITDFSRPHIQNCFFKNIEKYNMNVFGGSEVTYNNIKSEGPCNKIKVSGSAKCQSKSLNEVYEDDENSMSEEDCDECCEYHQPTSLKTISDDDIQYIKYNNDPEVILNGELKPLKQQKFADFIKKTENMETKLICSKCKKHLTEEDEPGIIPSCGHILCNNCKGIARCPLCDSIVRAIKKMYFEEECTICYDKKPNTISLPCGHLCMCFECASKCHEKNFNCPKCNEALQGYKFMFNDIEYTEIFVD